MRIRNLQAERLHIPFHLKVSHASATRAETDSILVSLQSESGRRGFGEACPRQYVTRECSNTSLAHIETLRDKFTSLDWSIEIVKAWVDAERKNIDQHPAAWCAFELALLDLLGKEQNQSIDLLLTLPPIHQSFQYTAVIGACNADEFRHWLFRYIRLGMHDFKIKLSGDAKLDQQNIEGVHSSCPNARVRVDANNLFSTARDAYNYCAPFEKNIFAIEEPVVAKDYTQLHMLAKMMSCKIILDESFTNLGDFQQLEYFSDAWIINLRLSKMGGLLRSLEVIERARSYGLPIIIGAHVGETSILTRAALSLASHASDLLLAMEGAFGTWLLKRDIGKRSLRFGEDGKLCLSEEERHAQGLGIIPANCVPVL